MYPFTGRRGWRAGVVLDSCCVPCRMSHRSRSRRAIARSVPVGSRRRQVRQRVIQHLSSLIKQRPWVLWGSAWLITIALSSASLALLSNPLFSGQPSHRPTPLPSVNPVGVAPDVVVSNPRYAPSPMWSLGAIALCSILGSLLIVQSTRRR